MPKKIIEITLKKTLTRMSTGWKCVNTWPGAWRAEDANVLAYEEAELVSGEQERSCIAVVNEVNLPRFLEMEGVREIGVEEAQEKCEAWRQRDLIPVITSPKAVIASVAKLLGSDSIRIKIPDRDLDILDPDSPVAGINRPQAFNIEDHL